MSDKEFLGGNKRKVNRKKKIGKRAKDSHIHTHPHPASLQFCFIVISLRLEIGKCGHKETLCLIFQAFWSHGCHPACLVCVQMVSAGFSKTGKH